MKGELVFFTDYEVKRTLTLHRHQISPDQYIDYVYATDHKAALAAKDKQLTEAVELLRKLDECHSFAECMRVNAEAQAFLACYEGKEQGGVR